MTLYVPAAFEVPTGEFTRRAGQNGAVRVTEKTEWRVFVDVTGADGAEKTLYLAIARRKGAWAHEWTVQTGGAYARNSVRRLGGRECAWADVPPAVRRVVLHDLGIAE